MFGFHLDKQERKNFKIKKYVGNQRDFKSIEAWLILVLNIKY